MGHGGTYLLIHHSGGRSRKIRNVEVSYVMISGHPGLQMTLYQKMKGGQEGRLAASCITIQAFNPSTWDEGAGRSLGVSGQLGLHSKFSSKGYSESPSQNKRGGRLKR